MIVGPEKCNVHALKVRVRGPETYRKTRNKPGWMKSGFIVGGARNLASKVKSQLGAILNLNFRRSEFFFPAWQPDLPTNIGCRIINPVYPWKGVVLDDPQVKFGASFFVVRRDCRFWFDLDRCEIVENVMLCCVCGITGYLYPIYCSYRYFRLMTQPPASRLFCCICHS